MASHLGIQSGYFIDPPNDSHLPRRYPARKDENWWLVVGDPGSNTLYAIKRVTLQASGRTRGVGLVARGAGTEPCGRGAWQQYSVRHQPHHPAGKRNTPLGSFLGFFFRVNIKSGWWVGAGWRR